MLMALQHPDFDPVAFSIWIFDVRWYALAYIAGLVLAWLYCRWMTKLPPQRLKPVDFDDFLLWATLGVVLGGRLGYILFYKPDYYLANPLEVVFIWRGGMSFHGGLLGVLAAIGLFARSRGVSYFTLSDIVGAATPIGLCLGRIANFINGELYGRTADSAQVPWAMVFPHAGPIARHPSQLYESLLEGLILFLVLHVMVRKGALQRTGLLSGAFMIGYGLARIIAEFFREPDEFLSFVLPGITMGQALSFPMVLIGIAVTVWALRRKA
ncbi:prolipoprotein diacylglyceryl transferase [Pelagibius marinus]|uniref:prolipoprotein diacylglyceryl transferase n=1 Tax=Pelagibius marinus TaxID=2762760 RepID=UPI001872350A|nr:prolipoprotein diacylglyceryl transferase [Pelagibius marinus]